MPKFPNPVSYQGSKATQKLSGQSRFATSAEAASGTAEDLIISPSTLNSAVESLVDHATTTTYGLVRLDTDGTLAAADNTHVPTALAAKTYIDSVAIAGSPAATEGTAGIAEIATQAETVAYADDTRMVSPLKLGQAFAAPPALGTGTAAAGTFTDLTADGTGVVSLGSNAAGNFTCSAGDLTLQATAASVNVVAGEAAADAMSFQAAAGGLDLDAALQINIATSQNAANAMVLTASAGGIDMTAAGAAGEDIDIVCTSGSVNITAGENAADSIVITSSVGGIDITAAGAGAGEDIDITATGSSINITATENVADSIVITSSNGGIDIVTTASAAGEDIDITANGSSVNITATENAANAIYLHANGGVTETIKIHADQGTGVASVEVTSDVGGVTVSSGLASADAINITASNAAGGIDVDAGTAGVIVDTTGAISLDAAAASNFTATGAFDITLNSTAGSMIMTGGEAAADAIDINASNLAGGIDVDAGTGGITIDTTGALSLDSAAASNFTVTGAFDLTLASTAGSIIINPEEAAADAIRLLSAAGGLDADVALQMNLASSQNAADAIRINASAGGIDIDAAGAAGEDITVNNAAGSISLTSGEAIADSLVLTAGGGMDILAPTGGAGLDIDIVNTGGSINISATENAADAITIAAANGGIDFTCGGAAGEDIDITNTSGSINITAGESASDAFNLTASGAASGMNLSTGTGGFSFDSGMKVAVTSVIGAGGATAVNGDDFILAVDTSGGTSSLTLPAAPATGRWLIVVDVGAAAGANNITINGNGKNISAAGTLAATKLIDSNYGTMQLVYNGTFWNGFDVA